MLFLRLKALFYVQYTIPPPAAMLGLLSLDTGVYRLQHSPNLVDVGLKSKEIPTYKSSTWYWVIPGLAC